MRWHAALRAMRRGARRSSFFICAQVARSLGGACAPSRVTLSGSSCYTLDGGVFYLRWPRRFFGAWAPSRVVLAGSLFLVEGFLGVQGEANRH